jgi:hypothetical protein
MKMIALAVLIMISVTTIFADQTNKWEILLPAWNDSERYFCCRLNCRYEHSFSDFDFGRFYVK